MIKSFKHKGLETFFITGSTRGIQAKHAQRLSRILDVLDEAKNIEEINTPSYRLHKLSGSLKNHWSIKVSGNWRITFYFEDGDVYIVNYLDYH